MRAQERSGGRGGDRFLSFSARSGGPGFSIVDHLEKRRCEVQTGNPVSPHVRDSEPFDAPIDRAVSIHTDLVSIPHTVAVYVRDGNGEAIQEVTNDARESFTAGEYRIEITAPIKLYVGVETGVEITVTDSGVTIRLEEPSNVIFGARAHRDQPVATITTTDDPGDLMSVLTATGSALETTSCERSYPTLRGHPPEIERGEALRIPDSLDSPDTGVTIEVPPRLNAIYAVSTLAFYLGADVVPGPVPLVRTDAGFTHRLADTDRSFENEVERVLKQCFFLDCVTRTEGYYPVDLHERNEIEGEIELDFASLYDQPLATQIETYLDVPYDIVQPHLPRWKLTGHVEPDPGRVETLPFLVNDLASIKTKAPDTSARVEDGRTAASMGIDEFLRGSDRPVSPELTGDRESRVVHVDGTDALEDVWVGEGIPVGASKGMTEAFHNRLRRTPSEGDIDITVVVNDPEMAEEGQDVNDVYGTREKLPFDVTIEQQLTAGGLERVLQAPTDFLHYVGHIDEGGFECVDGKLDVGSIEETGVDAFFLNACDSYHQGTRLIEAGAVAGVVTLATVPNDRAKEIGKRLARLLNLGYPLYAAVDVATIGHRANEYMIVGDGGINIVQPDSGAVAFCEVEKIKDGHLLYYQTFTTKDRPIGSITTPHVKNNTTYYLTSGDTGEFEFDKRELHEFITQYPCPVKIEEGFYWGD